MFIISNIKKNQISVYRGYIELNIYRPEYQVVVQKIE